MKIKPFPFWTWNKNISLANAKQSRKSSGKASFNFRMLHFTNGIRFGCKGMRDMKQAQKEVKNTRVYAEKFGAFGKGIQ